MGGHGLGGAAPARPVAGERFDRAVRTLFVTRRTARDEWEGQSFVPVALPYWVTRYQREFGRDRGPTVQDPLPDAVTGATPKGSFSHAFAVGKGEWSLYLEVNVSGDYNEHYQRVDVDGGVEDFGNGQPSLVYRAPDITGADGRSWRSSGRRASGLDRRRGWSSPGTSRPPIGFSRGSPWRSDRRSGRGRVSPPATDIEKAAAALREAEAVLIGAGAGMGVDSGSPRLPRERGFLEGLPALRRARPVLHGHGQPRLVPRRPGAGLGLLRAPARTLPGHRAPRGLPAAGRLGGREAPRRLRLHLQRGRAVPEGGLRARSAWPSATARSTTSSAAPCARPRSGRTRTAVDVDEATFLARPPLPSCPHCGAVARPNILMFGDGGWHPHRTGRPAAGPRALAPRRLGRPRGGGGAGGRPRRPHRALPVRAACRGCSTPP